MIVEYITASLFILGCTSMITMCSYGIKHRFIAMPSGAYKGSGVEGTFNLSSGNKAREQCGWGITLSLIGLGLFTIVIKGPFMSNFYPHLILTLFLVAAGIVLGRKMYFKNLTKYRDKIISSDE